MASDLQRRVSRLRQAWGVRSPAVLADAKWHLNPIPRPIRTRASLAPSDQEEQPADHPIGQAQALKQQTPNTHLATLRAQRDSGLLSPINTAATRHASFWDPHVPRGAGGTGRAVRRPSLEQVNDAARRGCPASLRGRGLEPASDETSSDLLSRRRRPAEYGPAAPLYISRASNCRTLKVPQPAPVSRPNPGGEATTESIAAARLSVRPDMSTPKRGTNSRTTTTDSRTTTSVTSSG